MLGSGAKAVQADKSTVYMCLLYSQAEILLHRDQLVRVAQSVGMQPRCYLCISRQVTATCEVHQSLQKRFTDAQQGLKGRGADPEGPFAQACELLN